MSEFCLDVLNSLYYTQYKIVHECFALLNRNPTVQVSDTTEA